MSATAIFRLSCLRFLPVAALSLAAACGSNPPTMGDIALAQGKEAADLGKKWNRGTEMVEDGQDLIEKGKDQIEDGNDNIDEGRQLITKGKKLVAEAEAGIRAQQRVLAPVPVKPAKK
ncbi:hypothetical protein [Stenotrophobium rhamnosiphilum]|uniref:Uncharacterized protein n=1 Tax=Stenotrophobium rhamnosiphilum TaxID=2029166 RepID=A0A2T5MJY4_9GAMM|nr:hypothetical protein [Stenotrophobium rhamnosiphilum]PTU32859.1 hypothetical protein CJD38_01735 [Stenotrophobium rhamnosiphilum]